MNKKYVNLDTNPCKMCMPMGGSVAMKGIENSMILMHGSQGCSTYIRRHMATHYNEPIDIASTSLSENGTVYGGKQNLERGLSNVRRVYNPSVIGVLTTCLAETIGEDIKGIIDEYKTKNDVSNIDIIPINTPGYGASHFEGYFHTIKTIIKYYNPQKAPQNEKINIIVPQLSCEDIRAIKLVLESFHIEYILIPDISETLDSPYKSGYSKIPDGGTKADDIKQMSGAGATIEMSLLIDSAYSPGKYLEAEYGVPLYKCPIPIGLTGMECFLNILSEISSVPIAKQYKKERGRMIDAMIDSHKYNGEGKAAVFGDPETVYALTQLCLENGIEPLIVATGTKATNLCDLLPLENAMVLPDTDFETIHEYVKKLKPNILIGNSDGKILKEKENIPLIRIGFPVHDHIGAQRRLNVGYAGSLRLLDEITNTLLDIKHDGYRQRLYNQFFLKQGGA